MRKLILLPILFCIQFSLLGQVTIGSDKRPEEFSTLEVSSAHGGIRYPQMDTPSRNNLATTSESAHGLMLYNTSNEGCLEYYSGDLTWVNLCKLDRTRSHTSRSVFLENKNKRNTDSRSKTTLDYQLKFDSIADISELRIGKWMDTDNLIVDIRGGSTGYLSSTSQPIEIEFSQNIFNSMVEQDKIQRASIYAIYNERGNDKRKEYMLEIKGGVINITEIDFNQVDQ